MDFVFLKNDIDVQTTRMLAANTDTGEEVDTLTPSITSLGQ